VSEPTVVFLELLAAAIASGRAHVAGPDGLRPISAFNDLAAKEHVNRNADPWGWRPHAIGAGEHGHVEWQPQGRRIGWIDGPNLYLEPQAAYAEAQRLAGEQGEALTVSARTLWRRMRDRGLLVSTERGKLKTRQTVGGQRRYVIHVTAASLHAEKSGESGQPGETPEKHGASSLFPSPGYNGGGVEQGEQNGQKTAEKLAPDPSPPIPPVPGPIGDSVQSFDSPGPYGEGY
jgi:hypothetical protein